IPGVLFITAAFFFYLRAKETGQVRHFLLAGLSIGAVMGTRYQLAPLPFSVILLFELLSLIGRLLLPYPLARAHFPSVLRKKLPRPLGEGGVGPLVAFAI